MSDFYLQNEGTIYLLTPVSPEAEDWADEHLPDDARQWASSYVIEHRYVGPIVSGIYEAEMTVGRTN